MSRHDFSQLHLELIFPINDKIIIESIIYLFYLTGPALIESTDENADLKFRPMIKSTGNAIGLVP